MLIPQGDVSSIKKIYTESVDLSLVNSSTKVMSKLNIPPGYKLAAGQSDIITVNVGVR
jgi:YbbR domain-containing protein